MNNVISHPDHYAGHGIECMDAMKSMMYGVDVSNIGAYWWGCAFKYIWRIPKKENPAQDILKAMQCLRYMAKEEGYDLEDS